ncbi:2-oxoacid:acceptor oxidoreductase subunit alpha [Rhodopseudomonas pseudopalustris]|uniref:2-oxoglutarate ferredoxin oxidoreductase subunit alpha n=1 Tax=Rhodopseudomonas pseudopalustris TaxID=1513892 RepID=A0A1H8UIQ0_9BRAD|nr:2-oxoacid:acceptor oxidoreductase subunit alpha [Rhodopseudomonas pseudopalustris]SEP03100.1 2-oxoglutarate ferredoxin oxidoreductase subunit alpha [Rhodopseudomonas pseudopalustris]
MSKPLQPTTLSIALTGSGGAGVMTAGQILLDAAAHCGLYGLMTRSSGPQIRGGEAAAMIRLATQPVQTPGDRFDLLLALDFENVERFAAELPLDSGSLIVVDPAAGEVPAFLRASGAAVAGVPMAKLAKTIAGGRVAMIALGILAKLTGLPESSIIAAIATSIGRKKPEAMEASANAVRLGASEAPDGGVSRLAMPAEPRSHPRWSITGNEAAGLGALRGGVKFVGGYPITPATEILEWLAGALPQCGGVLMQAEDELASINMIVGASYGGLPSLTATAGPGLSLMIETLGLAVASEIPLVVIDVMRSGPSTGIATKSEQSDLNIAVYGLHGDAPHVVTAPLSIADCLLTAQWSVHLAETLQTPVIMLSDQSLGQTRAVIDRPEDVEFAGKRLVLEGDPTNYQRYAQTESGVSPMAIPGTAGGQYTADGLTHTPRGAPSSQARDHVEQMDKRQRKLDRFDFGAHWAEIDGDGDLAVLTWGSSSGPLREAVAAARAAGIQVRLIALRLISPTQPERLAAALQGVKRVLVIEQNHAGQFWRYLRAHYALPDDVVPIHCPGPLPIRPGEALAHIQQGALA